MFEWLRRMLATTKRATALRFLPDWQSAPNRDVTFASLVEEGYRRNSAVFACVRTHASSFPEPPLVARKVVKDQPVTLPDHPLTRLLEEPNPFMGQAEFWAYVITYLAIGGNCYVLKQRNAGGGVVELWPLHDGQMRPVLHPTRWISEYRAEDGTQDGQPVAVEDVIHLRWAPDPRQPQVGLSPIIAVAREVDADNEAARYVFALLKNDATPRTIIAYKDELDPLQRQTLKEQFKEKFGGSRRGDVLVSEGGDLTISRVGLNLNELADNALRAVPESRIAAALEVPAILAGLNVGLERATFANAASLREYYTEQTLVPRWRLVADQFRRQLLPEFGGRYQRLLVEFDLKRVRALNEDEDKRAKRYRELAGGPVLTVNESRAALGYAEIGGGDTLRQPVVSKPGGADAEREREEGAGDPEDPEKEQAA